MMRTLVAEIERDVHLGGGPNRRFVKQTRHHIPGSTIRGAFGAQWFKDRDVDADFISLFEGGARFGPLYFGSAPAPASVLAHKYDPTDACATNAWDLAFVESPEGQVCPDCGSPLELGKGEVSGVSEDARTHNAMTGAGIAEDGKLFGRAVVTADVARGQLVCPDELFELLEEFQELQIGGRRTTHGEATMVFEDQWPDPLPAVDDGVLVIRLGSPAVFVDDEGYPTRTLPLDQVAGILGVAVSSLTVDRAWTRWSGSDSGGFHMPSALPKHAELPVAAGSTYRVRLEEQVSGDALRRIATVGLGLRRHEGFGHLIGAVDPGVEFGQAKARRLADLQRLTPLATLSSDALPGLGVAGLKRAMRELASHGERSAGARAAIEAVMAAMPHYRRSEQQLLAWALDEAPSATVLEFLDERWV